MNTLLEMAPEKTTDVFGDKPKPKRIMVVDDDMDIRLMLAEMLQNFGYEVDDAENGARAWEALPLKHYDLLITDHDMPEMTGLQLAHKLRSSGNELPVVFASGRMTPDVLIENPWLHCATLLPKPFTLQELIGTVKNFIPETESQVRSLI